MLPSGLCSDADFIRRVYIDLIGLPPTPEEMDAFLATPDRRRLQGQRDYALLLFLYNTGARASEAAQLTVGDLDLLLKKSRP